MTNHPKKGSTIWVSPIRDWGVLQRIKRQLKSKPRDYALFLTGINTPLKGKQLLSLQRSQVIAAPNGQHYILTDGEDFYPIHARVWRTIHAHCPAGAVFTSARGTGELAPCTFSTYVKQWVRAAGDPPGNYAGESLRKTWAYWQIRRGNFGLDHMQAILKHSTEQQTLDYLGIQHEDVPYKKWRATLL